MVLVSRRKQPRIFIDMDGVLANFALAASQAILGDEAVEQPAAWPKGSYDIHNVYNLSREDFWAQIDAKGAAFWANLSEYVWARALFDGCTELGNVYILSAPSRNPSCVKGKLQWLQQFAGDKFRDYLFVPAQHKKLLAAPTRFLVEDSEQNAAEFVAAGGSGAVIVPQPWNTYMLPANRSMNSWVVENLKELICRVR